MREVSGSKDAFGLAALAIGFCALAAVVLHLSFGPITEPTPLEQTVAEKAVALRNAAKAAVAGKSYRAPEVSRKFDADVALAKAVTIGGLAAIALGGIALVRRESLRFAVTGATLGGLAMTFQVAIVLAGAVVFAVLVAAMIVSLGAKI